MESASSNVSFARQRAQYLLHTEKTVPLIQNIL